MSIATPFGPDLRLFTHDRWRIIQHQAFPRNGGTYGGFRQWAIPKLAGWMVDFHGKIHRSKWMIKIGVGPQFRNPPHTYKTMFNICKMKIYYHVEHKFVPSVASLNMSAKPPNANNNMRDTWGCWATTLDTSQYMLFINKSTCIIHIYIYVCIIYIYIPEGVSEYMPDRMSDRMSEHMPERMSEYIYIYIYTSRLYVRSYVRIVC